jgi:hypothetical protein
LLDGGNEANIRLLPINETVIKSFFINLRLVEELFQREILKFSDEEEH